MKTVTLCKGCQHTFIAVTKDGKPSCPICMGISPDCGIPITVEVGESEPILCGYCGKPLEKSEWKNTWPPPFFEYHPIGSFPEDVKNKYDELLTRYHNKKISKAEFDKQRTLLDIEGKNKAYGHRYYCGCKGWD